MKDCAAKNIETIKIKVIRVKFESIYLRAFDIPKFRGYLSAKYSAYTFIHNHLQNDSLRYAYPLIQFKTIQNKPVIIGMEQGIEILKKVFLDIDELLINEKRFQINEKSVILEEYEFGQINLLKLYRFISPWMALNQENHKKYTELNRHERPLFLKKILAGNIKSLSKGFNYFIPDFDNLNIRLEVKPLTRNFKNIKMTCFQGTFQTNFLIPDYLGIGKQSARGFGTVEAIS
ncbi:MAG: CRISPR-associated endonuclease Cas6 [Candidatus Omnitrophota bacterium]